MKMHSQTWANSALGLERKGRKEEGGQEGVPGEIESCMCPPVSAVWDPSLLASICQGETVSSRSPSPTFQSLASLRLSLGLKDLHYAFRGTSGKEPTCQCRRCKRLRFDPWVGKIPGGRHGNPLQYSFLGNLMDRGAWRATVHWVAKGRTRLKRLSMQGKPTTSSDAQLKWRQFLPGLGKKCLY